MPEKAAGIPNVVMSRCDARDHRGIGGGEAIMNNAAETTTPARPPRMIALSPGPMIAKPIDATATTKIPSASTMLVTRKSS